MQNEGSIAVIAVAFCMATIVNVCVAQAADLMHCLCLTDDKSLFDISAPVALIYWR